MIRMEKETMALSNTQERSFSGKLTTIIESSIVAAKMLLIQRKLVVYWQSQKYRNTKNKALSISEGLCFLGISVGYLFFLKSFGYFEKWFFQRFCFILLATELKLKQKSIKTKLKPISELSGIFSIFWISHILPFWATEGVSFLRFLPLRRLFIVWSG